MANGNTTVSRSGQINLAGDDKAIFLKVFAGEVITTFEKNAVMKDLHRMRTIKSGKSAQFPALGTATAKYHTVGENILDAGNSYLSQIAANERVISIDSKLVSAVVISDLDEAMSHFDVRGEYARKLGYALQDKFDTTLLKVAVLCSRASATITGGNTGGSITDAAMATSATVFIASACTAAQQFDEDNVPEEDRHIVVSPAIYWKLVQDKTLMNRDYNGERNGVFFDGKVFRCAGMQLHKSNNLPTTNIAAAATGENNTYFGDFTKTKAVCFHREAIGTVKLMDLSMKMVERPEVGGDLVIASYAMGHGILRPECAIELATP